MAHKEDSEGKPIDVAHVGPVMPDGTAPYLRHKPDGTDEVGVFLPLKDGQALPPGREVLCIEPLEGDLHKVTSLYGAKELSGPAQVATPAYRSGYDRIFGKAEVGLA